MKDLGTVISTIKPSEVEVRDDVVFVASDIKESSAPEQDGQPAFSGYTYSLKQYDTSEYIRMISEQNTSLAKQATDAQMALCDLYEMIGG